MENQLHSLKSRLAPASRRISGLSSSNVTSSLPRAKEQERRTKILSSIAGVAAGRTYRPPLMMGRTRTRARISSTDTIAPFSKSVRQCNFPFFCSPRRVAERLKNVFTLQVGVRGQHLLYGVTRADELDDCADRDTHGTYRGLAAHEVGIVGDSVEVRHGVTLTQGPDS